jgi:hypothetical protein
MATARVNVLVTKVESRADVLRRALVSFQECAVAFATHNGAGYDDWEAARAELLTHHELLALVPKWVAANRSGSQFWQFIKAQDDSYAGRRQFIWSELEPLFTFVERGGAQPTARSLQPLIAAGTSASIEEAWSRIQLRRATDPEGAITLARTLLESTCKELLHKLGNGSSDKDELPKLYERVASAMNLGPQGHKEKVFKHVLGGCLSVVNGLAALRNAFGDAHGKGPRAPKPTARHADLAINLAGTLASFLMATYEERFATKPKA